MSAASTNTGLRVGGDILTKPIEDLTRDDVRQMTAGERSQVYARCMTTALLSHIDRLELPALTLADRQRANDLAAQVASRFDREFNIRFDPVRQAFVEVVSGASTEAAVTKSVQYEKDLEEALRAIAFQKVAQYGLRLGFDRALGTGARTPIWVKKEQIVIQDPEPMEPNGHGKFAARFDVLDASGQNLLTSGWVSFALVDDPYGSQAKSLHFTRFDVPVGLLERQSMGFVGVTCRDSGTHSPRYRQEKSLIEGEMRERGWLVPNR
jgi:hypothetical protein